jgi:hypothetical protein
LTVARSGNATQQAALHQIAQVILAERAVARDEIAHAVILALQRVGCRHAGQPAEGVLAEDLNRVSPFAVQLLGAAQLVALLARVVARESLRADHQHRRLRADLVGGGAAETRHQRRRVLAAKRAEFSGKNDELSRERRRARLVGLGREQIGTQDEGEYSRSQWRICC